MDMNEKMLFCTKKIFLRKMVALGFLNKENAAIEALPQDIEQPSSDSIQKTIILFHDETTFQANDDETLQWG